jgi:hypothetical protein
MGREQTALAKAPPREKSQLLRVRSHDEAVNLQTVFSVVFSNKIRDDSPAGHAMLQKVVSNPKSPEAKALMREENWQGLKFVFPATARADEVLYVKWSSDSKKFLLREGGVSYRWLKSFRTVHLG